VRTDTLEGIHLSLTLDLLFQGGNKVLGKDINRKNDIFVFNYGT
jgi:hypothetical protein